MQKAKNLFLMLCMVLLLVPIRAQAAQTEKNEESHIYVGGNQITEEYTSDEGWSYDTATNTLHLNNYSYRGNGYKNAAIYSESDLKIVLSGENQIDCQGYYGICVKQAKLTISGDGLLDVAGTDFGIYTTGWDIGALTIEENVTVHATSGDVAAGSSYGIRADGAFTIRDSAVVTAQGGYAPKRSCGIYAYTTLDICDNASVTTIGGSATDNSGEEIDSYGIRTTNMTVSGGTLHATAGKAKYASCGIYTQTLDVSGGKITCTANRTSQGPSMGIQAIMSLTVSDGNVEAIGADASANMDTSCGIYSAGIITVSDGKIVAKADKGGYTSGIQAAQMNVSGGNITATVGQGVASYSSGIQLTDGMHIENGTIHAYGGEATDYSYGIQVAADISISGGTIDMKSGTAENSYGCWAMGLLTIECDNVTVNKQEQSGLNGTKIMSDGAILAGQGINMDDTLTFRTTSENAEIKVVEIKNIPYYTIVEDHTTVAQQIKIQPLSYRVEITGLENAITVEVPAKQSINEAYCGVFEIEDFSERLDVNKEGYTFEGWYCDDKYENAFDFDKKVTGDITLYGKWTPITYTVTYIADGKVVSTLQVEHGKNAAAPVIPAKNGFTAVWDKDGTNITADTQITAVYTKITNVSEKQDTSNETGNQKTPQTGDARNVALWLFVLAASVAVIFERKIQSRY